MWKWIRYLLYGVGTKAQKMQCFYIFCITPVDIYVRTDANIEDGTMIFSPKVGEGDGSVVSSVTDKYGFLAGDVLQLEVSSTSASLTTSLR